MPTRSTPRGPYIQEKTAFVTGHESVENLRVDLDGSIARKVTLARSTMASRQATPYGRTIYGATFGANNMLVIRHQEWSFNL